MKAKLSKLKVRLDTLDEQSQDIESMHQVKKEDDPKSATVLNMSSLLSEENDYNQARSQGRNYIMMNNDSDMTESINMQAKSHGNTEQ